MIRKNEARHSVIEKVQVLKGQWFWLNASRWLALWFLSFCSVTSVQIQSIFGNILLRHPHLLFHFRYAPLLLHCIFYNYFSSVKETDSKESALGREDVENMAYSLKLINQCLPRGMALLPLAPRTKHYFLMHFASKYNLFVITTVLLTMCDLY